MTWAYLRLCYECKNVTIPRKLLGLRGNFWFEDVLGENENCIWVLQK